METLFQFELAFLIATMALLIGYWQVTNSQINQIYKYLFFVIGILLLLLMFLWVNYAQSHLDLIVLHREKFIHYLVLSVIQYLVIAMGFWVITKADKSKLQNV